MASNELERYEKVKQEALDLFALYFRPEQEWTTQYIKDGVQYKEVAHPTNPNNVFYGCKDIATSLETISSWTWNMTKAINQEFDADMIEWKYRDVEGGHRIIYQLNKIGWPIWDRSFVTLWFFHRYSPDCIVYGYRSIQDPLNPEKPDDDVRGTVMFSAEMLTDLKNGKVRFERLLHADPAGALPAIIVNQLAYREVVGYLNFVDSKVSKK